MWASTYSASCRALREEWRLTQGQSMLDVGTSSKCPAPENLRGTVKRRVTGKTGPVELSEKAAAQHWAENVLRWTGKCPTPPGGAAAEAAAR